MRKFLFVILIAIVSYPCFSVQSQETHFGKNKVRYKNFEWSYIQSRHFDIYFYEDAYETAKFTATVLEASYVEISNELNYYVKKEIPVFIYNSHNDFQQTNIIGSIISEGVGGFTEAFKNRIVIPFTGSYEDLRHVLHHELTHAVIYDMIYGNIFKSMLSRQRLFNLPLWYAEGYAEYSSRHGWDYFSDMFVRDATINGYLTPPMYLGGFLAYKQGQAMVKFIADKYGEEKLGEILRKGKIHISMSKALKSSIGINEKELWEEFSKEMKKRYWPEIAIRDEVEDIAEKLTKSREDGSYFNEKPEFLPDGEHIIIFTDKSDFTEIVMITAEDGERVKRLVKSQRSGDLESLHSYVSGVSVSPDGRKMVFVAKSKGKEALFFHNIKKNKTYNKRRFDYYNIVSPIWSPDGKSIAFSALKGHKRDLFIYSIENDNVTQVTNDRYDDLYCDWMPDSKALIFQSDRPHPDNIEIKIEEHKYVTASAYKPGDFSYGAYNLFRVELATGNTKPVLIGPGHNKAPKVSPDGQMVAFVSNRNGIDNLYVGYVDSSSCFAMTDILTGVNSLSWAPDGDAIAFSAFNKGAFDIFIIDDLAPKYNNEPLKMTDFMLGKYDLLKKESADEILADTQDTLIQDISDSLQVSVEDSTLIDLVQTDSSTVAIVSDSTEAVAVDSTVVVATIEEPVEIPTDSVIADSTISETGVYDGEYVFVSEEKEKTPLDSLLTDIAGEGMGDDDSVYDRQEELEIFDERPNPAVDEEFPVKSYKTRFTPDYIKLKPMRYDTFLGLQGGAYFVFSDYLGNHQLYFITDLVNTIDQSNFQLYYFYNRMRTRLGVGFFHSKNFYLDNFDNLFSDRFYGIQAIASRPFSTFSRIDLVASHYFIDREYRDWDDPREDRSTKVVTGELSYIFDNVLWGITGPVNGRRVKFNISTGFNPYDSREIDYSSVEFDYRKYWHFGKEFSMAFRFSSGASFGGTPKQYFLGGTSSVIQNRTVDAKAYEVENLYFADVVTPLRSIDYYGISGNRYGLLNWEFRFPMIDYFIMRFPLRLALARIQGAIFLDMGSAWTNDNFKGGTSDNGGHLQDIKTGFGYGMRANLGFLVLRFDQAWGTDFKDVSDKPSYYISFGADF